MKTFKLLATGLVSILCTASLALAQEEQVGGTSYSDTLLTVTTTNYIEITGVADPIVSDGAYSPATDEIDVTDDFRVYTNSPDQHYKITATCTKGGAAGLGGACTAFTLGADAGPNTDEIAYEVRVASDPGGSPDCTAPAALAYNTPSAQLTGTDTYSDATENACVRILIAKDDIMAVAPDTYTGVLKLTAIPDAT